MKIYCPALLPVLGLTVFVVQRCNRLCSTGCVCKPTSYSLPLLAGVTYEIVDAVDAANTSIPLSEVKK
jgi:hypothetical protein